MLEGVLKGYCVIGKPISQSVSILGMLEGVLKAVSIFLSAISSVVSILGMLEGVLKVQSEPFSLLLSCKFQSLVCWRGC